jgi:hypothetical protein
MNPDTTQHDTDGQFFVIKEEEEEEEEGTYRECQRHWCGTRRKVPSRN